MFAISENFISSAPKLRKEFKRRQLDTYPKDEIFENEVWCLLYKLGFSALNEGRSCNVKYGRSIEKLQSKNVDIIAESDDLRLYIECTTQKIDLNKKIKQWVAEAKQIEKYDVSKTKNIVFMFYSKYDLNAVEKRTLKEAGIAYLNPSLAEYYSTLNDQYSRLAYFELISYILKNKEVKKLTSENLEFPAIRCKYGTRDYCYLFAIQPSKLIPLSTVPHKKQDHTNGVNQNYQRMIKKVKVNAIKKFITEKRGVFPTNIIISVNKGKKSIFKTAGKKISDISIGTVTLPSVYQSINIIDGQHRLFAYDGLPESESDLIYVVAFENMELEDQIQTFIDINEKQTKVSPSLLWDLYPTILDSEDIRYRVSKTVKKLNESESSLKGVISYDSAPYSKKIPKLTLESVCTAIKTENIHIEISSYLTLMKSIKLKYTPDQITFLLLDNWFQTIIDLDPDHWARKNKTMNLLRSNQAFGAMIKLFSRVMSELYKTNILENEIKNSFKSIQKEFKVYLLPILMEIKNLKTKDEIKNMKRIGEGGKQQLFIDFVRIINKKIPDFGKELLSEKSNPEIEEIINKLQADSEHFDLEIKESFFVDVKRSSGTGTNVASSDDMKKSIIKTVVGFANYLGGKVVIGIEDGTWKIKGIDKTDLSIRKDWDTVKQGISERISKLTDGLSPKPIIRRILHENKSIVIIDVKPISNKALQRTSLVGMGDDCYARVNGSTEKIKGKDIGSYCEGVLKEREELEAIQND